MLQPARGFVRRPVPAFVILRAAQAEIGGEIDYLRRQACVLVDFLLRFAVRQGQEEHIAGLSLVRVAKFQGRLFAQVGMHLVYIFTQVAARGDLDQLHLGMRHQQARQLAAGIP